MSPSDADKPTKIIPKVTGVRRHEDGYWIAEIQVGDETAEATDFFGSWQVPKYEGQAHDDPTKGRRDLNTDLAFEAAKMRRLAIEREAADNPAPAPGKGKASDDAGGIWTGAETAPAKPKSVRRGR